MSMLYLYAFVQPPLDVGSLTGVEPGSPVFLVETAGVGCAVSRVPADAYDRARSAGSISEHLAWITPRAMRHHEIVAHLHDRGAALPLKFGTLCADEPTVRALLIERRDQIAEALAGVHEKDEWTLTLSADQHAVTAGVLDRSPQLVALEANARDLPDGRAYFARRRFQREVAMEVANACAELERTICERLGALDIDHRPAAPRRDGERQPIAVLSLLVGRGQLPIVETMLAKAELEAASCGFTCEITGPWPAYNFVPRWETPAFDGAP